jgi:hypothetical protein
MEKAKKILSEEEISRSFLAGEISEVFETF